MVRRAGRGRGGWSGMGEPKGGLMSFCAEAKVSIFWGVQVCHCCSGPPRGHGGGEGRRESAAPSTSPAGPKGP